MKLRKSLALLASALNCSCAPDIGHPQATPAAVEGPEDFSGLLRQRTPRSEAELTAALGAGYRLADAGQIQIVRHSLATKGRFAGYPATAFGNRVVRVTRCDEAQHVLDGIWPARRFAAESALARLFARYPSASVVSMDADDQQILFFDPEDRLVAVYPENQSDPQIGHPCRKDGCLS